MGRVYEKKEAAPAPHWSEKVAAPTGPTSFFPDPKYMPPKVTRDTADPRNMKGHHEKLHYSQWRLDMKTEVDLGLAPADWSTSSAMADPVRSRFRSTPCHAPWVDVVQPHNSALCSHDAACACTRVCAAPEWTFDL